jgi:quinol monooxygenase YgiN
MAYVVAATWIAKDGAEDRVAETIRTMTPLSRAEEGTLLYQAQVSVENPRHFFLYEQYVDAEAYEAHKASQHFQDLVIGFALGQLEERRVSTFETLGT